MTAAPLGQSRDIWVVDITHLIGSHLFGQPAAATVPGPFANVESRDAGDFVVTGIVALTDASDGYAMLGRKGQPTHLYRAGAALQGMPGASLYQVFADHVVLDFSGVLTTLKLPTSKLMGVGRRPRSQNRENDTAIAAAPASSGLESKQQLVSAAQTLLADLQAEQNNVDGQASGMLLHPSRAYQRRYGVHEGDVLTSVNGVEVTDAASLDAMLRDTSARSLTLTYVRDGQQHVVGMAMSN